MELSVYREREFPITESWAYLNHAAVSPLPNRVVEAMVRFLEARRMGELGLEDQEPITEATRLLAAQLLNASPEEIAFVGSTSDGLNLAAQSLPLGPGDNVILCDMEFPANVYPWMNLRRKGVEVRIVPHDGGGLTPARLAGHLDSRTRAVTVSSVQFLSGYRADLPALARLAHEAGAVLVVDAIQSLGAVPMDVRSCGVDILAANGAKWLMAPIGITVLYVRREWIERLQPTYAYYSAVVRPEPYLAYDWTLRADAQRFEPASPNVAGLYGLHAALSLLLEVGVERIYAYLLELTDHLISGLEALGFELLTPRDRERRAGIVTCRTPDVPGDWERLKDAHVLVSQREGYLRISPHFYNLPEEIDRLLEVLASRNR
ncbi:MAG: aminotransferase class V-fold PLP-dependent enzyme [Chloroflexia bacterium]